MSAENQQRAADKVFDHLGLKRVPVTTELTRISKDKLPEMIENYDEVARCLAETPYADLLTRP